jgi:hypothetical protein
MERLTYKTDNNYYVNTEKIKQDDKGYTGEAVELLAKFENYYEDLVLKQEKIIDEMEKLKADNKTNTVKFKQLFARQVADKIEYIWNKDYQCYI